MVRCISVKDVTGMTQLQISMVEAQNQTAALTVLWKLIPPNFASIPCLSLHTENIFQYFVYSSFKHIPLNTYLFPI